jgi:hypothetical protein
MLSRKRKQSPQARPKPQKKNCLPYQQNLLNEIALLIRSRYGLIWLDTLEEERAESLLRLLASRLELPFFIWSVNSGLYRDEYHKTIYGTHDPPTALDHIHHSKFPALYHVQGLGPFMEAPVLVAKLVSISRTFADIPGSVVVTGGDIQVNDTLKPHVAYVKFPAPSREEYADLLQKIYRDLNKRMDVSKLPPEFLRKGRFDEIFFVDLPDVEARTAIFQIHLKNRKQHPRHFDLRRLVQSTDGFSGAEIEQVIGSALYTAFADNCRLNTELLLKEVHSTNPLSRTRFEQIEALRRWAQGRTVSAQ